MTEWLSKLKNRTPPHDKTYLRLSGINPMKKLLLTSIAALLLATGTAHANDQLPEFILGRWCYGNDVSTEAQIVYFRPNHRDPERCCCSDMTDGITIDLGGCGCLNRISASISGASAGVR